MRDLTMITATHPDLDGVGHFPKAALQHMDPKWSVVQHPEKSSRVRNAPTEDVVGDATADGDTPEAPQRADSPKEQ